MSCGLGGLSGNSTASRVAGWQYTNRFPSLHRIIGTTRGNLASVERHLGYCWCGKHDAAIQSCKNQAQKLHVVSEWREILKRSPGKQPILLALSSCRYQKYITDVFSRSDTFLRFLWTLRDNHQFRQFLFRPDDYQGLPRRGIRLGVVRISTDEL